MKNFRIVFIILCTVLCVISCNLPDGFVNSPFSQFWGVPQYDENVASKILNVAAVSFYVDLSPEVNRNKIVAFIDKIKAEHPDVRLILFPETTLGYYYRTSNSKEYQKSIAETIPGYTTDILSQKAIEKYIYISFGMVEISGEELFNSQVLIDPDGIILSIHHKNYFIDWDKENGYKAGKGITVDIIDNIKVATIVCYDDMFLNIHQKIHESGTEMVLLPVANTFNQVNLDLIPINYTNTWVLCANRIGNEDGNTYDGWLYLITPSREPKIVAHGKEGYIYGVVRCK